jgi:hypothetical protein
MKKIFFILIAITTPVIVILGITESYFQLTKEKKEIKVLKYKKINHRPVNVTKDLGMIFHPHQMEIRSNGYDYHCVQKTNRFGFLDAEHDIEKKMEYTVF